MTKKQGIKELLMAYKSEVDNFNDVIFEDKFEALADDIVKLFTIHDVVKSFPTEEEKQFEKINSFNRLKKEAPELDQVMYCTGFVSGVKWFEKEITK